MLDSLFLLTCDEGSTDLALEEVSSAAPASTILDELAPGIYLVDAGEPFAALAVRWQTAPPIFVRHIAPVQLVVPLGGHAGDVGHLTAILAASLPPLDPAEPFSVQTRILADLPYKPFDVNTALSTALAAPTPSPTLLPAPVSPSVWRPRAPRPPVVRAPTP